MALFLCSDDSVFCSFDQESLFFLTRNTFSSTVFVATEKRKGIVDKRQSIGKIGIHAALAELYEQAIKPASTIVRLLQQVPEQALSHALIGSALMDKRLLVEDFVGACVVRLFDDASFHGKEASRDRISRFIPDGQPFTVTLDPLSRRPDHHDRTTHFEMSAAIRDAEGHLLGALVHHVVSNTGIIGAIQGKFLLCSYHDQHQSFGPSRHLSTDFRFRGAPERLCIDIHYSDQIHRIEHAGYEFCISGNGDPKIPSYDLLWKACRGTINRHVPKDDADRVGLIVQCCGGVWRTGLLDPLSHTYDWSLTAATEKEANILAQLLQLNEER